MGFFFLHESKTDIQTILCTASRLTKQAVRIDNQDTYCTKQCNGEFSSHGHSDTAVRVRGIKIQGLITFSGILLNTEYAPATHSTDTSFAE